MKRIKFVLLVFIVLFSVISLRLFYVSVIDGQNLSEQAVAQRTEKLEIKSPRGIIYDKNMIKITDADMELAVSDGKPYYVDKSNGEFMSHIVGYISPDGGGCGVEGAFDYVLSNKDNTIISYLKDINNNMVSDVYASDAQFNYSGVSLSVDYHIQKIVEEAMDMQNIKGAAVVADCKTGEIAAMASRPNFDRNNLVDYLGGVDGELVNKSIVQYNPGSVFKIIVMAAALENSINEDAVYNCTGKTEIDGIEFVCHKEEGHGLQSISEAFANSCNCAFYEIGAEVGTKEIYKYASLFGIGSEVLRINGISENTGFVPTDSGMAENANISIGQGRVMVTPVQMADVVCTICNGGVRKQLTLIKGLVDENGICTEVEPCETGRVITETTARRLMDMMKAAVKNGTGKAAELDVYGAGGKTGSAETGWRKNGELMQQGWFAGFFPAEEPEYICVVIAENGKSGSDSACPVFNLIGEKICGLYNK